MFILCQKLEINIENQYVNRNSCSEFISYTTEAIKQSILIEMKQSRFINIKSKVDKGK